MGPNSPESIETIEAQSIANAVPAEDRWSPLGALVRAWHVLVEPQSHLESKICFPSLFLFTQVEYYFHLQPIPAPLASHHSKMATALENVLNVWNRTKQNSPIYNFLLDDVDVYEASKGVVRSKIRVSAQHLNSKNGLHGAFSACVVDWAGGMAIASHGFESTGVSTDIHVSYLSKASLGDWLEIESRTDKVGKTLGYTSVTISKLDHDGQVTVVAKGSHTKYIRQWLKVVLIASTDVYNGLGMQLNHSSHIICRQPAFFFASSMTACPLIAGFTLIAERNSRPRALDSLYFAYCCDAKEINGRYIELIIRR